MSEVLSAAHLHTSDPALKDAPFDRYSKTASRAVVEKTKEALESHKHKVTVVNTKEEALEVLKKIAPSGSTVMNAGSTTLIEVGLTNHMKTQTEWDNFHAKIFAESDPVKQAKLRKEALVADYYFTSVSAITEDGSFMACDLTGTRTGTVSIKIFPDFYAGAFIQAANNVVIVAGSNKIVPTLEDARKRQQEYCLPFESARARVAYAAMGVKGSNINNSVEIRGSNPWGAPGRFQFVLVHESLGF